MNQTNGLLKSIGIATKPLNSVSQVTKNASSMFVAVFEALFQVRLKAVHRKPSQPGHYEHNAQMVLNALSNSILNMDLSYITGQSIVAGDQSSIANLVDIFVGISEVWLKRRFQNDAMKRFGNNVSPLASDDNVTAQTSAAAAGSKNAREGGRRPGPGGGGAAAGVLGGGVGGGGGGSAAGSGSSISRQRERSLSLERREGGRSSSRDRGAGNNQAVPLSLPARGREATANSGGRGEQEAAQQAGRGADGSGGRMHTSRSEGGGIEEGGRAAVAALQAAGLGRDAREGAGRPSSAASGDRLRGGQRPGTADARMTTKATATTAPSLHESIAAVATDYPGSWRDLMTSAVGGDRDFAATGTDPAAGGPSTPGTTASANSQDKRGEGASRLALLEKRFMEDRENRQKSEYRRLLKDRLVTLRRRDILENKKQMFRQKGARHTEKVRKIKIESQNDVLKNQQLAFKMKRKNAAETRMRKLYLSMIKSLHESKREAELADSRKLIEMKRGGAARAQALDMFFEERIELVNEHLGVQEAERIEAHRAQEEEIRKLLRELGEDSKKRIERAIEGARSAEEDHLRRGAEATIALAQVVGVEDWNGVYKDRYLTPFIVPGSLKGKDEKVAGRIKKEVQKENRKNMLRAAYGSGVGSSRRM